MKEASRVPISGPLAPYAEGFQRALREQGYTPVPTARQLGLMAHASRWLTTHKLGASDLTPDRVEQFLKARRGEGYKQRISARAMSRLMEHLRRLGVIPTPAVTGPATPLEELLEHYRGYLIRERGLAASTIPHYLRVAQLFLSERASTGGPELENLAAAEVTEFVLRECRRRSVGSAKGLITGLRSLLRFLHVDGRTPRPLAAAVPQVAGWKLSSLPRGLDAAQVARLLASCDRRTAVGRRDFAILTVLVRLGLRAGEVAALELSDVDWRSGELRVHRKGGHEERLPLPADVGEAVVAWLRRDRPRRACTKVFTRVCAPHGGLTSQAVSAVVRRACHRTGLPPVGAHSLRHTAATQLLRAGAGLAEVGQVLGHRSALTTAIYAKVDRASLSSLALPWPGSEA